MNIDSYLRPVRLVAIGLLTLACATTFAAGSKFYDIEYQIISAALNHGTGEANDEIIIDVATAGGDFRVDGADRDHTTLAEELGATVKALRESLRLNRRSYTLQTELKTKATYQLLETSRRSEIFNNEDPTINWQQFRRQFPDAAGIIRVSRPGIDETTKTALVYVEFECGAECGSGRALNLAQQSDGTWAVVSGFLLWITSPEQTPEGTSRD
ncbi:MAG: hypothetical protein ACI915_004147 [Gammaproteobacteria bacterium]|jgi:hypothetical protein